MIACDRLADQLSAFKACQTIVSYCELPL